MARVYLRTAALCFIAMGILATMANAQVDRNLTGSVSTATDLFGCPTTSSRARVFVPVGTALTILCQVRGETVGDNTQWLWTNYNNEKGYISDLYVNCVGTGTTACDVEACF